jgi:hypothetical protein
MKFLFFLYKICEHYLPLIFKYQNFLIANRHLFVDADWPKFWAVQLWMLVLLFVLLKCLHRLAGWEKILFLTMNS